MRTQTEHTQTTKNTHVYCHQVKYIDGDTLSVASVQSKPRETIHILLSMKRERDEVLAAAREVEAHSFYDNQRHNAYVVDSEAMDKLCSAMGKVKP